LDQAEDRLRVIVVEDDAVIAADLAAIIESVAEVPSTVVRIAATAAEALVGARETGARLAFIDANLVDGRTGPEAAELLEKHFGLRVVLATSEPQDFDDSRAQPASVLLKPFTPEGVRESLVAASRQLAAPEAGAAAGAAAGPPPPPPAPPRAPRLPAPSRPQRLWDFVRGA
jgi:CheY-like chemotaxis protein